MSSQQALDALGHAASGSVGSAISTAALFPLDLVTTRLKAQGNQGGDGPHYDGLVDAFKDIVKNEGGISALYSGIGPDIAKSLVDSFLFFGFYTYLRPKSPNPRVAHEIAMGALAGACSKAMTTPVSNIVARQQMSSGDETLREILNDLRRERGILGLWSGFSATLVLTINPSITFLMNRRLAARIIPALEDGDVPVAWVAFLLAALSKAAATAFTYPFQTGKTRLQMPTEEELERTEAVEKGEDPVMDEKKTSPKTKSLISRLFQLLDKTIFGVILRIIKKEGVASLYDGLQGELLKSFFSHGLTIFTKGVVHRMIVRLWLQSRPHLLKARLQAK